MRNFFLGSFFVIKKQSKISFTLHNKSLINNFPSVSSVSCLQVLPTYYEIVISVNMKFSHEEK